MKNTIDINTVKRMAFLSRLEISDSEAKEFSLQLSETLNYVHKLNELDTEDIEPTIHVLPLKNVLREDKVRPSLTQERALMNASCKEDGYFKVPKIVE